MQSIERKEELKTILLAKAFNENRGEAMVALIDRVTAENRKPMPPGHKFLMDAWRAVRDERLIHLATLIANDVPEEELPVQSRALDRLNLQEKLRESGVSWTTYNHS